MKEFGTVEQWRTSGSVFCLQTISDHVMLFCFALPIVRTRPQRGQMLLLPIESRASVPRAAYSDANDSFDLLENAKCSNFITIHACLLASSRSDQSMLFSFLHARPPFRWFFCLSQGWESSRHSRANIFASNPHSNFKEPHLVVEANACVGCCMLNRYTHPFR